MGIPGLVSLQQTSTRFVVSMMAANVILHGTFFMDFVEQELWLKISLPSLYRVGHVHSLELCGTWKVTEDIAARLCTVYHMVYLVVCSLVLSISEFFLGSTCWQFRVPPWRTASSKRRHLLQNTSEEEGKIWGEKERGRERGGESRWKSRREGETREDLSLIPRPYKKILGMRLNKPSIELLHAMYEKWPMTKL